MANLSTVIILTGVVLLSACSDENSGLIEASGAISATPDLELESTPESTPTPAAATPDESNSEANTANQPPTSSENAVPSTTAPNISFQGTSLQSRYGTGDTVLLDGRHSTVDGDTLISFQWTQVDTGAPMVALLDASTATASFVATAEIDGRRLSFELTVLTSGGETSTSTLNYAWNIETPPEAVTVAPATLSDGYYTLGKAGGYYAESASSIFIADQEFNQIVHVNAATDTVIDSFGVLAAPTDMAFVSSTRTIYTALADAGKLAKLKIDTGELTEITIASEALSISAYNGRVYYTVDEGVYTWRLFSIDDSDVPVSHGVIQGDMIELNPINGEIVAAWTGTSPASVYRYGIDSSGAVSELQFSRDLGSNARDIAFSPDGIQLVVASGSGNGSGYTFHDILASDLSVSSGSWDTSAYPRSADFSNTGNYFAASNTTDLFVFDSLAHTLTEQHDPNEAICGLNYYTLEDVLFSEDDKHVFAKLTCGFDKEKTVLFYYNVP